MSFLGVDPVPSNQTLKATASRAPGNNLFEGGEGEVSSPTKLTLASVSANDLHEGDDVSLRHTNVAKVLQNDRYQTGIHFADVGEKVSTDKFAGLGFVVKEPLDLILRMNWVYFLSSRDEARQVCQGDQLQSAVEVEVASLLVAKRMQII